MSDVEEMPENGFPIMKLPNLIRKIVVQKLDIEDVKKVLQVPVIGSEVNRMELKFGNFKVFVTTRATILSMANKDYLRIFDDDEDLTQAFLHHQNLQKKFGGVIETLVVAQSVIPQLMISGMYPREVKELVVIDLHRIPVNEQIVNQFLQNIKVTDYLYMDAPGARVPKKMFEIEQITLKKSGMGFSECLGFNNRVLFFNEQKASVKEVNNFLRNWMNGSYDKLEFARIALDRDDKSDESVLMDGLSGQEFDPTSGLREKKFIIHSEVVDLGKKFADEIVPRKRHVYIWENLNKGIDIVRKDGRLATIVFNYYVSIYVWKDRFPSKRIVPRPDDFHQDLTSATYKYQKYDNSTRCVFSAANS